MKKIKNSKVKKVIVDLGDVVYTFKNPSIETVYRSVGGKEYTPFFVIDYAGAVISYKKRKK